MKLDSFILNNFFDILNDINANYCVMNNYHNMPEEIPSDVDFAVDLKTYHMLDSLVIDLANRHNVSITQKIWHGYHKCAYILSPLKIDSFFWLQLDFFVDFSGRGFPNLLPSERMLSGKRKYKNFYVPKAEVEVPFLLQRRIFKGDIEDKHVNTIVRLYKTNIESVKHGIVSVFGVDEGDSLIKFIESGNIDNFKNNYSRYRARLQKISSDNTNVLYRIKYTSWQFIRAMYRLYYPTGLSIAFIGEDTIAKRKFIQEFDDRVSGSFHGVTHFSPKSFIDYLKAMVLKDYWSKVTKRKTLWNLDTSVCNWNDLFSKGIAKLFIPLPDVIIGNYDQHEEKLNELVFTSLSIQAARTKRHLMNKVSPTARIKFVGYDEK